jgi:hypothetical protein
VSKDLWTSVFITAEDEKRIKNPPIGD